MNFVNKHLIAVKAPLHEQLIIETAATATFTFSMFTKFIDHNKNDIFMSG
jgi:hypothetical protein